MKNHVLWHQSGVNQKGEPFVQLFRDETIIGQFTPQEARDHATTMIEAAEAAEQDSFLWHFYTQKVGTSPQEAMSVIVLFRQFREARGKKGPPSDRAEFVDPTRAPKLDENQ